ncbi:CAAX protease [Brachybacterium tyrofermentans]|uniref:CAAX protease n=1 Tax=Brachybacterium tyrofermentans TaxID=47848 RepID=A0ABW0FF65_9MICO
MSAVSPVGGTPDLDARPTPYHRLATLRPAWSAWGRPLLTVVAAVIAYVVLASVLLVLTILVLALAPGVNVAIGVTSGDPTSPLDVGIALAMGALWWPAAMVGVRIGGWRPLGPTWSVAARLRRERLRFTGALAVLAALVVVAAAALAGGLAGAGADGASAGAGSSAAGGGASVLQMLLVVLLVLVLVPLQALGLELALRGMVLQAVGTWLRSPVIGILVVAALAFIGREATAAVMVPALAAALAAAVLAWKTGGLELPIVLTATTTGTALIVSALAAGSGTGAGVAALGAAVAAPGTSAAALAGTGTGPVHADAALAGGVAAAVALLVLAAVIVVVVSRREGLRLLEPVGRAADEPVPDPVLI